MEKSLKIVQLKDKQTDFLYWSSKNEIERLSAIEILRQQFINYKNDVQPNFKEFFKLLI